MDRTNHRDIRVGTLMPLDKAVAHIHQILPHGFESFQLTSWMRVGDVNVEETAKKLKDILGDQAIVSSVAVFGNILQDEAARADFERMIRYARLFGATTVCGFAGALEDRPVDQSIARFKEVWGPLAKIAEDEGVKIGFENCDMGGTWEAPRWNIAHSQRAWELMFDAVPSDAIGLEWEPCHQMVSLVDPIRNLRKWVGKVVHVHGKDATINWDVIEDEGLRSGRPAVEHRTPGFGDTNWSDVITILRKANYQGTIDIEGWHDPVYKDDLEMTGQVYGLNYLKACRGGDFAPNPQ